jgi:DNA ligase-1
MIEKMGEVSVEPKYDGVRVQIHYDGNGVKTFSRNLENTTEMFPELEEIGKHIHADSVILDTEAAGIDPITGKILPFQETTTRKRKHDIQEALKSVPLRFYVFDILYKDGNELLTEPLSKRRDILGKTMKKGTLFEISPHIVTNDPDEIRNFHAEQLKHGLEGVVVKKWDGGYESGRRSYNWVKFKEEEGRKGKLSDTVDAVVMGYYYGEGKRSSFGIGAFLVGVRKNESIVTVTKIGTGVSDEQWRELLKRFELLKEKERPKEYEEVNKILIPDVWLAPKTVVEIAGDDLTKSPNHGAGYAVRFPRLIRVREDKSPGQATTVKEIKEMFENQGN